MSTSERIDPYRYLATEATEILRVLAGSDVDELELEQGAIRLRVRRTLTSSEPNTEEPSALPRSEHAEDASSLVTAPVVGWFRRSATIDGPPLADVGHTVEAGQRLAIIEAVQVVHDVVAERAGVVVEVLVADGEGVGYGQPLFRLAESSP